MRMNGETVVTPFEAKIDLVVAWLIVAALIINKPGLLLLLILGTVLGVFAERLLGQLLFIACAIDIVMGSGVWPLVLLAVILRFRPLGYIVTFARIAMANKGGGRS